jgi:7-cyano-7-deazaguanine synthase
MNIEYAQASNRETAASKSLAEAADVTEHLRVPLPFFKDIQARYHPTQSESVGISPAYVPARNLIFYGVAAAYAEALGIDTIVFGSNADDTKELPDARPRFVQRMNELFKIGTRTGLEGTPTKIINPLISYSKADVLRLAVTLRVPLELTWSCYENVVLPCGKCRGCQNRLEAFKRLRLTDPLRYT